MGSSGDGVVGVPVHDTELTIFCRVISFTSSAPCFPPGAVVQELLVDAFDRELNVPNHAAADEAILDREQVGVELAVGDRDVVELDVEVLVYRVHPSCDCHVVLELDGDCLVRQRLEKRVEQHGGKESRCLLLWLRRSFLRHSLRAHVGLWEADAGMDGD